MTRINSAISPKNLTDQHLIAELRELPRVFALVDKRRDLIKYSEIPKKFCLGIGHVKFWYNKLKFLHIRHTELITEYELRFNKDWQYRITPVIDNFYNDYRITPEEYNLLIERISTRINESKQVPRYYSNIITKEKAIEILKS